MKPTLCSKCKKNLAVVFITKIENGQTNNEGYCLKCARELGIKPVDDMISRMGLSDEDLDNLNGEMLDNYFSNDMHYFVRWTSRSITLLIISWVFAVVTLFTNVYVNLVFQAYMVTLNFYIAINFTNFCTKYGDIARAYLPAGEDPEDIIIKPKETDSQTIEVQTLEQRINTWMEAKEYVGSQFTIDELATKLGTNKGYLSFFINEHFGTNFSVWVSGLRINEAKQLMTANPERKMEDIAYTVGFSSPSYFSKVFASHEGMSPTVWRREVMSK